MDEIDFIISKFEKLETNQELMNEDTQNWIINISSKEFALIKQVLNIIKINLKDENISKKCILLIYKLLYLNNNSENNLNIEVLSQLRDNKEFFDILRDYILYCSNNKSNIIQEMIYISFSTIFFDDKFILPINYIKDFEFSKCLLQQAKNITNESFMNLFVKFFIKNNFFQICQNLKFIEKNEGEFLDEKYSDHSFCIDAFQMIAYNLNNKDKLPNVKEIFDLNSEETDIVLECSLRLLVNNNMHKEDSLYTILLYICLIDDNNKSLFRASDSEALID